MSLNVVVIGANRGIGLEFCKQYVSSGNHVTAVCRQASSELNAINCDVIENIDVTDQASVNTIAEQLNIKHIDILIHNSGILHSDSYPNVSLDEMKLHFDVNTLGPLRTIQALESRLKAGSKVGIVSSRVGSIDDNTSSNNYAYRVSKTAVNMLGKCLSIDLAPKKIALALLHPGYVRTDMTHGNGLIEADEAAVGLITQMQKLDMSSTGMFVHTSGERLTW